MSSQPAYGAPETRRRILQATWKLIEERGGAIRLIDVADRAGVSRQAVYLHFRDRAGLLLALVQHIPESLGFQRLLAHVIDAPTGVEALQRAVELHSTYHGKIDSVARVLEADQYRDEALRAPWRDRMDRSRAVHRAIIERIAEEGQLAPGWTVDKAADLFYVVTMQGPWRELTRELGWTADQYAEGMTRLLRRCLLVGRHPSGSDSEIGSEQGSPVGAGGFEPPTSAL